MPNLAHDGPRRSLYHIPLPLKLIRIGDLDYCCAATPIHLFTGIPMASASLSQLENLVLQGTGGEQCLPPPSSRTPDTSTQT